MDRDFAKPLDVAALARIAYVSEAHFIRTFRGTFGETSLGTFSRTFTEIVGEPPTTVDDVHKAYEELRAKGVEFTEEPTERFYGTDCGLRDPFGNPLRIGQPKEGPIEVPSGTVDV
jgi:hypothetical protein